MPTWTFLPLIKIQLVRLISVCQQLHPRSRNALRVTTRPSPERTPLEYWSTRVLAAIKRVYSMMSMVLQYAINARSASVPNVWASNSILLRNWMLKPIWPSTMLKVQHKRALYVSVSGTSKNVTRQDTLLWMSSLMSIKIRSGSASCARSMELRATCILAASTVHLLVSQWERRLTSKSASSVRQSQSCSCVRPKKK